MMRLSSCLLFLLFITPPNLHAQTAIEMMEPVLQKMDLYSLKNRSSELFVHFDKNIYTNSENVWFTGYLLKTPVNTAEHRILEIALVRDRDSIVISDQKFVMMNGMAFGNIVLPDSLLPGNYSFLTYTNVVANGTPSAFFIQPITVKAAGESTFNAYVRIVDKPGADSDSARLVFKAFSKDIHTLISHADVRYTLGSGSNRVRGSLKTDVYGEVYFKVPLRHEGKYDNRLQVEAKYKTEVKRLEILLPVYHRNIVTFYPEGGTLVTGNRSLVGWEAKDIYGQPLRLSAVLYENTRPVDTLQTNGYGIGKFELLPRAGYQYHIKLAIRGQETDFPLPAAEAQGPTVHIMSTLCNDTVMLRIENTHPGKLYGMLHNFSENFLVFPADMSNRTVKVFRVPLKDVPRGLTTLTILDSTGRPFAENIFFAHYDQRVELQMETDSLEYMTRQKVKLNIRLRDVNGKQLHGIVSVACVQDNRIDMQKMTDIESYHYLIRELAAFPFRKDGMANNQESRNYLQDILLVKGWRRYSWPAMLQTRDVDTLQKYTLLGVRGSVSQAKKPVARPIGLNLLNGFHLKTVMTDSGGHFSFNDSDLVLPPGRKMLVFVDDKVKYEYTIKVKDLYLEMGNQLVRQLTYEDHPVGETNTENTVLSRAERPNTLADVTVSSNKKDNLVGGGYGRNKCGDYVCLYNVLNCPNHFFGTMPVEGQMYTVVMPYGAQVRQPYAGCAEEKNTYMLFLKGNYTPREFYNPGISGLDPAEQIFLSTMYWNYSADVTSEKPTELTFYTNDIKGKFRIIIQGVTTGGAVHKEIVFTVRK